MKSTVFIVLLAFAGTVFSSNVTSTTTKPAAGKKKSTNTAKVTVPTVRPPVLPAPSFFAPQVQNWAPQPFPQQFTQPSFQPQAQFPFQGFASQQPSAFPQAPQPNFVPQSSFPSFLGQPPAFQQQQFPQPSFSQQPRVTSQPASPQNLATNTNVFPNFPQANFFAPVQSTSAHSTAPQPNSITSKAPSIPQKIQPAIPQIQSQQQQGAPAAQMPLSFPGFQPFQQRANPQPFQQQFMTPNSVSNTQPFVGFQQWQPMANTLGATMQPFPGLFPQPSNPSTSGTQAFEQFQLSDPQLVNSFTPQQSSLASFARPESVSWNSFPSNPFSQQQPQLKQPQFNPFMNFPQPNSVFA